MAIKDNNSKPMKNMVFEPDKLYGTAVGDKPDLMVYFDDLNWRSAGTVGHDSLYLFENDTGPDDSVHSMMGIFLMYNPKKNMNSRTLRGAKVEDMAPTILKMYGTTEVDDMDGQRTTGGARRSMTTNVAVERALSKQTKARRLHDLDDRASRFRQIHSGRRAETTIRK